MTLIISIALSILVSYVIYKCLETRGFKLALGVAYVINLVGYFLGNGFNHIFGTLILIFIVTLIDTLIDLFIYNKTNSFLSYMIVSFLVGLALSLLPGLLLVGLIGSVGLFA